VSRREAYSRSVANEGARGQQQTVLLGLALIHGSAYRAANRYGRPMRYLVMALIMVLTCFGLSTAQAATPYERESLAGLPGVVVVIETITPEAQADGLSEEAIRAAMERILQSSGIRILTQSETLKESSNPRLYVQPNIGKGGPYYFYNVSLRLIQEVSSVHGRQHTMGATTWEGNTAGIVSQDNLSDAILNVIETWVNTFANDFLAVNPR
jgi:hypothetical protein